MLPQRWHEARWPVAGGGSGAASAAESGPSGAGGPCGASAAEEEGGSRSKSMVVRGRGLPPLADEKKQQA